MHIIGRKMSDNSENIQKIGSNIVEKRKNTKVYKNVLK